MKKIISSPKAPKAVGPYSQAVLAGDTLYISGQLPINGETGLVPETIEEQAEQALKNVGYILEEAGMSYENVVKSVVYLKDLNDFAAMNAVYSKFYTTELPARVCYQVAKLPLDVKVEVETIAVK